MTIKKLLANLNALTREWKKYTFKVIGKTQHEEAKTIFVYVEENNAPAYVLGYRLDLNALVEYHTIYTGHLYAEKLREFEKAIEQGKKAK